MGEVLSRFSCDHIPEGDSCGLVVMLVEQYAKLQDENERLRSCLSDDVENARMIMGENAKLRELVRDMHKALFSLNLDHCQACPRDDACLFVHKSFDCDECAFERDMRELGIEVNE